MAQEPLVAAEDAPMQTMAEGNIINTSQITDNHRIRSMFSNCGVATAGVPARGLALNAAEADRFNNSSITGINNTRLLFVVHDHNYTDSWSYDDNEHWHECTICHDKKDTAAHSGGEASCSETAVCDVCGQPYGSLDADDHDYKFDSFVWDGFTAKAKYICANDETHEVLYDATVTSEVTTPATCQTEGARTYTAEYEGNKDTKTEVIPATDHDYKFDSFVWDGFTAKAKYICANDSTHEVLYDATVTSEVTTEPTRTSEGVRTYTAEYEGHTDTKTETIPPIFLLGDADRSGTVNSADAALILRWLVGMVKNEDIDLAAAKVTGGAGAVSSADAAQILRYTVGLISEL